MIAVENLTKRYRGRGGVAGLDLSVAGGASFLLKEMFQELKERGKALLISTHMLDTAERLCDRFVLLAEGTVAAQGTLDAIRETAGVRPDASLEEAFVTILRQRRQGVH